MTAPTTRRQARHYSTNDPAKTADRAAFNVGMLLEEWKTAPPVAEALVPQARDLVLEAIETYGGERVVVVTTLEEDRASVHVLSVACTASHPDDLIDPVTTAVLLQSAAYWGAGEQDRCLCATLAFLGDDWGATNPFLVSRITS